MLRGKPRLTRVKFCASLNPPKAGCSQQSCKNMLKRELQLSQEVVSTVLKKEYNIYLLFKEVIFVHFVIWEICEHILFHCFPLTRSYTEKQHRVALNRCLYCWQENIIVEHQKLSVVRQCNHQSRIYRSYKMPKDVHYSASLQTVCSNPSEILCLREWSSNTSRTLAWILIS